MSDSETVFSVVLILLLAVGPFALIVRSLIKYSDETFAPRYQPRTYRTSAKDFFLSTDTFVTIGGTAFGLWLLTVLWNLDERYTSSRDWTVYAALGLLVVLCLSLTTYFLILNLNHWKYTRDRVLYFDPEARTLTVQTSQDEHLIGEGDIERVEVFATENERNYQAYYRLKLSDGRELIITEKTKGAHAIFDFFQDIPTHRHKQWLPLIGSQNS